MGVLAPSLAASVAISRYEQGKYIARLLVWYGMYLLAAGQWGSTVNKWKQNLAFPLKKREIRRLFPKQKKIYGQEKTSIIRHKLSE